MRKHVNCKGAVGKRGDRKAMGKRRVGEWKKREGKGKGNKERDYNVVKNKD